MGRTPDASSMFMCFKSTSVILSVGRLAAPQRPFSQSHECIGLLFNRDLGFNLLSAIDYTCHRLDGADLPDCSDPNGACDSLASRWTESLPPSHPALQREIYRKKLKMPDTRRAASAIITNRTTGESPFQGKVKTEGDRWSELLQRTPRAWKYLQMRNRLAQVLPVAFSAFLVALWQLGASKQASPIMPGPWAVAKGLAELVRKGLLFRYIVASLFRVTWGYLSAAVLAFPIGLFLGWHRRAGIAFNPLIQILRPISALAWIPLSIFWFGVGDPAAIFLIFVASFLPLAVSSMNAVSSVDPVHLNAGRNFGLSQAQLLYRVVYPAVMPQLILGLRIAVGILWLVVVAVEMIGVNSGLGFLIIDARNAGNRYDLVVSGMLMIGLIGLFLDTAVRKLEHLESVRWAYGSN